MVPSRLDFRSVNASDKSREQHGCPCMGMSEVARDGYILADTNKNPRGQGAFAMWDDGGASMDESGKRSTTDLGLCTKDRATAPYVMPYHIDLPVRKRVLQKCLPPREILPHSLQSLTWLRATLTLGPGVG